MVAKPPPAVIARLRDGRTVRVRPIQPSDAQRLQEFHLRLSRRTTRYRFFTPLRELSPEFAERLANVDYEQRFAFVVSEPDDDIIYGVGRFEAESKKSGEVAFVVEDSMQGIGLGPLLLDRVVSHARKLGYQRLTASVLAENSAMLNVFRESAYHAEFHAQSDLTFVKMDISEPPGKRRGPLSH